MAVIPFALSIHHFITSVGADVGFASIIGLAVLVLLFFAQARETASLRRRADEADEQLHALHLYVDQLSRTPAPAPAVGTTVSPPVAAPPASARIAARPLAGVASSAYPPVVTPEPMPAGAVATIPAAPAGVGAPALSAATRLIPVGEPDPISIRALKPSNGQAGAGGDAPVGPPTEATPPPSPPPSTAAAGRNGAGTIAPPPSLETRPANGTVAPPPRVALRPAGAPPSAPPPPLRRTGTGGRPAGGRDPNTRRRLNPVALVLLVALGVAIIAVGVLVLTSSSGNSPSRSVSSTVASRTSAAAKAKAARHRHRGATTVTTAPVTPSSVMVAVLNATNTSHLAADVLGKLTATGYKGGPTANAAETGLSSTIVGYTQPAYRADALAVAKSLNLGPASVQGVSQGDRTAACGSAATCPLQVVVTVGSDLASAA